MKEHKQVQSLLYKPLTEAKVKTTDMGKYFMANNHLVNPYAVLYNVRLAILEYKLCTLIKDCNEPLSVYDLHRRCDTDFRMLARAMLNCERRGWVKVLYTRQRLKYYVHHTWRDQV